jgi:multisubunit Na+/H+ antiporter MnhC subunit
MSFDPTLLFLSLISGGIGLVLFVYGKKQQRWPHLVSGLALMGYPYLVSTVTMTVVVGVAIVLALWVAVRQGW